MKSKLIKLECKNLIECDNPNCDYVIPNPTKDPNAEIIQFINVPCPQCGVNLLTQKDYLFNLETMKKVNWVNKWFGWLGSKPSDKDKTILTIKQHNRIKIK